MGWTSTFFGNAKSSSSSSSSTTSTQNIDKRLVVDGMGTVGVSADHSTVTVNASDHGAIAAAFDLAKSSNAQTYKGIEGVLGLAGSTLKLQEGIGRQGLEATQKVLDAAAGVRAAFAEASNIAAGNKTLVAAGLSVIGLAAIGFALTRWKAA